jgi:TPP-dependent 2-oxoacid decarboxylase
MQNFLRPGDVIVVEDGASSAGMGRLTLPDGCTYITGAFVWCSIGYATPALLGAILGEGRSGQGREVQRRRQLAILGIAERLQS